MVVSVRVDGLDQLQRDMIEFPKASRKAAVIAVNAAARLARTEGSKGIQSQVALTPGYLNANLRVRYSRSGEIKASVVGRFRPTSLGRYAVNRGARNGSPARLRVKKASGAKLKKRLFLLTRLSRGSAVGADGRRLPGDNVGVAVRLKKGEKLINRKKAIRFSDEDSGLYLLYAPSVDQVFRTYRNKLTPIISPFLEREYIRQFTRLARSGS